LSHDCEQCYVVMHICLGPLTKCKALLTAVFATPEEPSVRAAVRAAWQ
jgi:hypothetical protein